MKYLSICIPAYEMGGKGGEYLAYSFDIMLKQTFQDFEVVISDQSKDEKVKEMCDRYSGRLDIVYSREPTGRRDQSSNFNNGLRHCSGKLVKILWLDDFFYHENALKDIVEAFDLKNDRWLATACIHTDDCVNFFRPLRPKYDDATALFKNNLGAPSVITIKNEHPLMFDENMKVWYTDLDYYKRYYDRYGMPRVINEINVAIRIHESSVTNTSATEKRKDKEWQYMVRKYHMPHPYWKIFDYKRQRYVRQLKSLIKRMFRMRTP